MAIARVALDRRQADEQTVTTERPRLLNTHQAAAYLNVSDFTLRDWILAGYIPTIDLPPQRPRAGDRPKSRLRRVLVDREDLDRFIEARKQRGDQEVRAQGGHRTRVFSNVSAEAQVAQSGASSSKARASQHHATADSASRVRR